MVVLLFLLSCLAIACGSDPDSQNAQLAEFEAGPAPTPLSITTSSWFPTTDTSLSNIDVQYAAFVTANDYAKAKDYKSWGVPTYDGGGGYSFGGGDPASCFMSAWAVEDSGGTYITGEDNIRKAAQNFAKAVTKFLLAQTKKATHVDFDIEEGYPSLSCISGKPALLATVEGQRFYGHAIHALAKEASTNGWQLNLDIQEPYLSLPFRSFDYNTDCPPPTTVGYTTCAPWMPMEWKADPSQPGGGASVKGYRPFYSIVTLLLLNNTTQVQKGDKFKDANGKVIDFTADGEGPDTWTMMGYPLKPGLWDVRKGAGGYGPYLLSDKSIDVAAWMKALFKALASNGVTDTDFSKRFIYASQYGTIDDGHVSASNMRTALLSLISDGYPLNGIAYWDWSSTWNVSANQAAVNTYFGNVKQSGTKPPPVVKPPPVKPPPSKSGKCCPGSCGSCTVPNFCGGWAQKSPDNCALTTGCQWCSD